MKFKSIEDLVKIPKELAKAYTEGVYADTPANRKLGRVGMSYAAYAEKVKGEEKKENSFKDKKEEIGEKSFNDIKDLPFTEKKSFPFGRRYGERKIGSANGHNYYIDTPATKKGKYFVDGKVCKDKEEFLKKINKLPKEGKFKNVDELPFGEKTRTRSGGWFRECTIDGHLFTEYDKEIGKMHGKYEIDYEPVSKTDFLSLANEYYK